MRRFLLASVDFKLVYKVQNAVKGIFEVVHIVPRPNLPKAPLIVASIRDKISSNPQNHILRLDGNMKIEKIKSKIIERMSEKNRNQCIVGIDPGVSIGVSIIFCDTVFDTTVIYDVKSMIRWIINILRQINFSELIFRVGNGGGRSKNRILKILKQSFDATIEEVNEKNTSIKEINQLTIHEQAAIKIARRAGNPV